MAGYEQSQQERIMAQVTSNSAAMRSFPLDIGSASEASMVSFQPFGPYNDGSTWQFSQGWQFETPATGSTSNLLAVSGGVLHYAPASSGLPATLALKPVGNDIIGLTAAGMPIWFPIVGWIVYRDVDQAGVQSAVQALLEGDARRLATVQKGWAKGGLSGTPTPAELAAAFVAGPAYAIPGGIPVTAGELIGTGEVLSTDSSRRYFELWFTENWQISTSNDNPAYFYHYWSDLELIDLSSHPMRTTALRIDQSPRASSGMRFVSKSGNDSNVSFNDPALPGLTLKAVLDQCLEGDTIVILDNGTYSDPTGQLEITTGINITSSASLPSSSLHLGPGGTDGSDEGVDPSVLDFPTLAGGESYAHLSDDMSNSDDVTPSTTASHRVLRYDLSTAIEPASVTKVIITNGGAREGGGIYAVNDSRVTIASCRIHRNIGYFNINPASRPSSGPYAGSGWFEEGSGGGIGLYKCSALIWGNRIDHNTANYGGAIGLFAWCFPTIRNNYLHMNYGPEWWYIATITDGGAIRVLQQSLAYSSRAELEAAVPPGNVVSPNPIPVSAMYDETRLAEAKSNWIYLVHNRIEDNFAADDGGGVYATAVARILSIDNVVTGNRAKKGDGGGFRISTASTLRSIRDVISGNETTGTSGASPTGGGIAVRASNLYLSTTEVSGNTNPNFAGAGIAFTATREGDVSTGGTTAFLGRAEAGWSAL